MDSTTQVLEVQVVELADSEVVNLIQLRLVKHQHLKLHQLN